VRSTSTFRSVSGAFAVLLAVLGGMALAAQDKYTVKVPNGLGFAEFRGYEDWQTVAVSQIEASNLLRAILANPVMINAYRAGIPDNGKPFPNGSKIAKLEWTQKKITEAPWSVSTPDTIVDTLKVVELIEKDTKRFPNTHGWGYAEFAYDAASDTFKPAVNEAKCGAQCHEIAGPARDYIFNAYAKR
jgi:Cytochrome P460